jgi:hypothetical protein
VQCHAVGNQRDTCRRGAVARPSARVCARLYSTCLTPIGGCFSFLDFTLVAKLSVYSKTDRNSGAKTTRLAELVSPSGAVQ